MTIWFPDISHFQAGLRIQPGTAAVCAKATEGITYADPSYSDFKAQASAVGAAFLGYHFIWSGTPTEASWVFKHVGKTPLMIDAENPNVKNTVAQILSFVKEFRKLGGVVHLVYLPHWYWQGHLGSPDLTPLAKAGLGLVSSNYTSYSDTGPGWDGYGGVKPVQWQYSDNFPYGGKKVDFNAFKGTPLQYKRLITTGSINPAPTPNPIPDNPPPAPKPKPGPAPAPTSGRNPPMIVVRVEPSTIPADGHNPGWGTFDGQVWKHLVHDDGGVNNGLNIVAACGQKTPATITYSQFLAWSGK